MSFNEPPEILALSVAGAPMQGRSGGFHESSIPNASDPGHVHGRIHSGFLLQALARGPVWSPADTWRLPLPGR
jgi:hypothetical protein